MAERRQIKSGARLAVQTGEQIQIECGGHTLNIVVGTTQDVWIFLQVIADQHGAIVAGKIAHSRKHCSRLGWVEVADARPSVQHGTPVFGG
jgi:hypothetical protein